MASLLTATARMETGPIVEIDSGIVLGVSREKSAFFKGIPFAAAPIGKNRFRPPQVQDDNATLVHKFQIQTLCCSQ